MVPPTGHVKERTKELWLKMQISSMHGRTVTAKCEDKNPGNLNRCTCLTHIRNRLLHLAYL